MKFADEFEAYSERHPLLHFTPCPPSKEEKESAEQHGSQTNQLNRSHKEEEEEEEEEDEEKVKGVSVEDAASCVADIVKRCVLNETAGISYFQNVILSVDM